MADIPPENVYPFRDAIERDIKKMKRQIASDDQSASSKNQQQKRHALEDAASGRRTLGDYARSNMNRLENANRTIASISVEQGQESLSEKASSVADILKSALESATPSELPIDNVLVTHMIADASSPLISCQ